MLKSKNLKLGQKFTLLLLFVFLGGIIVSGAALSTLLNRTAQAQVVSQALLLMETMNSVREYTSTQIEPELVGRLEVEFLPETVPAYSAREVFETFRSNPNYSDFFYKEATLNPTNLRDQADPFETDIVEMFRQQETLKEVKGFRSTTGGDMFYIARPIQIVNQSCLVCHSIPSIAPKSMLERYGDTNGFGWKLNEIVGAQIISVPAATTFQIAQHSWMMILGIVTGVFAIAIFMLNLWLKRYVVRPINRMAIVAEAISTGDTEAKFGQLSGDEVGKLAQAFNRMRLSLKMAIQRLEQSKGRHRSESKSSATQDEVLQNFIDRAGGL